MNQTTILIKHSPTGQYPYAIEVHIPSENMHLVRFAVTQEHAAIVAAPFIKMYPDAKLVWK